MKKFALVKGDRDGGRLKEDDQIELCTNHHKTRSMDFNACLI